MSGTVILLGGTLFLRVVGVAARKPPHGMLWRVVGWLLCSTAAWLAASAAGAWCPLWPALVVGVIGACSDLLLPRYALWFGADIVVVVLSGLFSIPPLPFVRLLAAALAIAGVGLGLDALLQQLPTWGGKATGVLTLATCIMLVLLRPAVVTRGMGSAWRYLQGHGVTCLLFFGLTPTHEGTRLVLATGAHVWLNQPAGAGPFPGALLFHGAHPDGSKQAAAVILRRALVDAGFVVLAVDHPGYGESPAPGAEAPVQAWDPLPTALAAFKLLRALPAVGRVSAFGHSMGATDVFRLLNAEPQVDYGVVFGASLGDSSDRAAYWHERFHTDRRLRSRLSTERVLEIRRRFYEDGRFVQMLRANHAPIVVVRFGFEHASIVASRDDLYEAIPGRKYAWDLKATHYFSSISVAGLVVGDTGVTRELAAWLRRLSSPSEKQDHVSVIPTL
jgi:pimeloyl-ACP methyl ester carboxylesterase